MLPKSQHLPAPLPTTASQIIIPLEPILSMPSLITVDVIGMIGMEWVASNLAGVEKKIDMVAAISLVEVQMPEDTLVHGIVMANQPADHGVDKLFTATAADHKIL